MLRHHLFKFWVWYYVMQLRIEVGASAEQKGPSSSIA